MGGVLDDGTSPCEVRVDFGAIMVCLAFDASDSGRLALARNVIGPEASVPPLASAEAELAGSWRKP